jgi:UDP-hydrolysing UDP-N-acetyl-D-glucosamine 2-epimerase
VGDRTETLGVAATACLMQIPLIHLQGGEVSGSIDNKIRDVNSKMADLHLTTNFKSKLRLQNIGEDPSRIFIVGCPSIDLVVEVLKKPKTIDSSASLGGIGAEFELKNNFGVILFHPDTFNELENIVWTNSIIELVHKSSINWLWFWPNPDFGSSVISKLIRAEREKDKLNRVRFIKNLKPEVFLNVANTSSIVIGNSSFGIRESSFLGIPVINFGKRQHGREKAENVKSLESHCEDGKIFSAFKESLSIGRYKQSTIYGTGNAGQKSAEILSKWRPSIKNRS